MKQTNTYFFYALIFPLLLFLNSQTTTLYGQVNESDSLALVALYNATDGANWTYAATTYPDYYTNSNQSIPNAGNPWLGGVIANWHGIELDASGENVTKITLGANGLNGIIPDLNLPNLTHLDLSYNELNGNIPNFTNLNNLTYLSSYLSLIHI